MLPIMKETYMHMYVHKYTYLREKESMNKQINKYLHFGKFPPHKFDF